MGSKSSTSSNQTVRNFDRRQSLQDALGISGDNSSIVNTTTTTNNITTTDHGAIKAAADQVLAALTSNSQTVATMAKYASDSQKLSGDLNAQVIKSSFDALGQKDHITSDLVNKYAELQGTTTSAIASAWQNAKEFEAGKSLGDIKWVIGGMIAVFGLMAWKKG
jgi:hypothetical protein